MIHRLFAALFLMTSAALATSTPQDPIVLWPKGAPGALGNQPQDIPTLTPYLPAPSETPRTAIIICPGGGYGTLAGHEGDGYARWLNEQGIITFVLKYRLGSKGYRHPAMLDDASMAMRLVRSRAAEWKIDPKRIGIMGSSAGGHLASTLLTHFDAGQPDSPGPIARQSSRPDFGILCYAVITLGEFTHQGSKTNLLGPNPPADLVELLSNEKQVRADTPPCFVWHTWADSGVPVENSLQFAAALRAKKVPCDLHLYQNGGHGMGLGKNSADPKRLHPWTDDLLYWFSERGLLEK